MQQIAEWLKRLGMSEYTERFAENNIDFAILGDLTDHLLASRKGQAMLLIGRKTMAYLLTIVLLLLAAPAMAEECFQIMAPIAAGATTGASRTVAALKLNRCTGETWVLSLDFRGGNTWRWAPVYSDEHQAIR